jgi:hypothetical protein
MITKKVQTISFINKIKKRTMKSISGVLIFRECTDQPSSPKKYCEDALSK